MIDGLGKVSRPKGTLTVAIHQPEFLPWIGFFNKMYKSDIFVLLDNVQFRRDYFQNRNVIKTPQGPLKLTVPVLKKGSKQLIKDMIIDNSTFWGKKQWKSIQQNYCKAPFFKNYEEKFAKIYESNWEKLSELNIALIKLMTECFGLKKPLVIASEMESEGNSTDLLLGICEKLEATTYLSGIFGKDYLEEDKFKIKGINVEYNHFNHPKYPQLWGSFQTNMSAIDLLFNCGESSIEYIEKS